MTDTTSANSTIVYFKLRYNRILFKRVIYRILYFCIVYNHQNKLPVLIILVFMLGGWLVSSCKKTDEGSYINVFLAGGPPWQLVSQQVSYYNGDTLKRTDTLNRNCTQNQVFAFSGNGTCTYTNYSCITQSVQGTWQLTTQDSLLLKSNIVCKDTTATGTSRPFANTQVINLGQNSLVLQALRIDTLRKTPVVVLRRRVTRYAFIH
jgi:hypothetical protein